MGEFVCVKNDRISRYETAASQTIDIGDFVSLDSAGQVVIADASSAKLLGVAAKIVTSTSAGDEILVYDDPQAESEGQADATGEVLQTVVGETHDLIVPGGVFQVN